MSALRDTTANVGTQVSDCVEERDDDRGTAQAGERDAFLAMESDLRTLRGVLAALRVFSQAPDPIDPAALAVLAVSGSKAEQSLTALWRSKVTKPPP